MKKILLFPLLFMLFSCEDKKPLPPLQCKEFSANCELLKPWVVIKPLVCSKDLTDAFGDTVSLDTAGWYILNTASANSLLPIGTLNQDYLTSQFSGGGAWHNFIKENISDGIIRLDTLDVDKAWVPKSFSSLKVTKFVLILSGKRQAAIDKYLYVAYTPEMRCSLEYRE